jgi:hypothetical protein
MFYEILSSGSGDNIFGAMCRHDLPLYIHFKHLVHATHSVVLIKKS